MKKFFFRLGAFFIDTVIALVLSAIICTIPFINPNVNKIEENQETLNNEYKLVQDLSEKTKNYIKDDKINQFEYKEILDQFPTYYELFKDVVVDEKLSDEFKDNIQSKIEEKYTGIYNEYSYTISKLSLNQTITTIIVYIAYFGILPFIMHGQTPAKKLLRLKVINSKDEESDIPLWKYIIRAILICELIFTVADLIMINVMSKNAFISASYWLNEVKYLYELAFLVCLVLREDQKSIHDLLLGTSVVLLDKAGNVIPNPVYQKEEPIKEIEEVTSPKKKTTTSKKTTKNKSAKKEKVKAEKVND